MLIDTILFYLAEPKSMKKIIRVLKNYQNIWRQLINTNKIYFYNH